MTTSVFDVTVATDDKVTFAHHLSISELGSSTHTHTHTHTFISFYSGLWKIPPSPPPKNSGTW